MVNMTSSYILAFVVLFLSRNHIVSSRDRQWDIGVRRLTSSGDSTCDHLVTNLPGQPHVDFKHYAGYITVNETNGRALFYWFYEAMTNPEQKPLVLWLNGGPGCSSIGYGATQEIGPFFVDSNRTSLTFNNFSWNKEANLLFLDSPIGVGYSYSNTTNEFKNLGDDFTANDSYTFLQNWFLKYPSYRTREFYIAGESYAGHYVPELAEVILDRNKSPSLHINLKGILVGNPETSFADDWLGMVDYAWSHAVISYETHKTIKTNCDFNSSDPWSNDACNDGVQEMLKQYKEIDIYSLYTPRCSSPPNITYSRSMQMITRIFGGYDPCLNEYAKIFYNRLDVQKALHANAGPNPKNWRICNHDILNSWDWSKSKRTIIPIHKKLISAGLRVWLYTGDNDGRVPVLSTEYSIDALGLPITKTWSPWFNEHEVSGWYQECKGLTFATFRGAGHDVPTFKPSNSLVLFSSFLKGESLPSTR